ncbi:MAG: hypothetical protein R3E95_10915 [Thiolinea sp.]
MSLTLALSFGFYGLVRKQAAADSLTGLGVETGLLLPFALAYWGWLLWSGQGHSAEAGLWPNVLLLASGVLDCIAVAAVCLRRQTAQSQHHRLHDVHQSDPAIPDRGLCAA